MQTSAWQRFSALYSKEMRELRPEIIIVLAIATVICLVMLQRPYSGARDLLIVPIFLLLGLAAFLPFISSFKLLSREWSNNTIYVIMSLPVKGGMILGAKLAALISQYIIGTLVVIAAATLLVYPHLPDTANYINSMTGTDKGLTQLVPGMAMAYLLTITWLFYLTSVSFFSQLVGKLFTRFFGLITIGAFLITLYLGGWLMHIPRTLIHPASSFNIIGPDMATSIQQAIYFMGVNSIIYFVAAALIFFMAILIYDYRIEL